VARTVLWFPGLEYPTRLEFGSATSNVVMMYEVTGSGRDSHHNNGLALLNCDGLVDVEDPGMGTARRGIRKDFEEGEEEEPFLRKGKISQLSQRS
jgi:hypothetical protein